MDMLRDNVRAGYRKYFLAAFGSALISCIYGVVDMAMVGQYQGCLLYTSPSPRDRTRSRMPSSA